MNHLAFFRGDRKITTNNNSTNNSRTKNAPKSTWNVSLFRIEIVRLNVYYPWNGILKYRFLSKFLKSHPKVLTHTQWDTLRNEQFYSIVSICSALSACFRCRFFSARPRSTHLFKAHKFMHTSCAAVLHVHIYLQACLFSEINVYSSVSFMNEVVIAS